MKLMLLLIIVSRTNPQHPVFNLFLVAAAANKQSLLGFTPYEAALVQQYIHLANFEFLGPISAIIYPLLDIFPYDAAVYKKAKADLAKNMAVLNTILLTRTFLVGDRVTAADIKLACVFSPAFKMILDPEQRKAFPNVVRWFTTVINQPHFVSEFGNFELCVSETLYKPKEAKKDDKPLDVAMAAVSLEEEERAPKKNPLDCFEPSPFNLDAWKRYYSNNETRPCACDYFWQNFDTKGWSMFRLIYKDNKDLTRVFMSGNLIGGFYQRLDHLRKYAFGSMCVFGEDNNNAISGMFIFRGPTLPEALNEVADFESYVFEQVDSTDPSVRAEWENYLAWDGQLNGMNFADGKIFK